MASWDTSPCCGVEVRGLHLATLSAESLHEVKRRFAEAGVVYFRDIGSDFGPEQHMDFSRLFGGINVNRFFPQVDGHEGIAKVEKRPEQKEAIGDVFHADHTYDLAPALGSMLVARELPAAGGDTVFCSMYAAYESLPEHVKRHVEGMRAVHSSRHTFGRPTKLYQNAKAATQDNVHPVVITHPLSGRRALFVNPAFTLHFEGQTIDESAPLLEALYHHALRPEHCHRFEWCTGSAALWDNRSVWHCAFNDYHGDSRLMHRITIDGVELEAAHPRAGSSQPFDGVAVDALAHPDGPGSSTHVKMLYRTRELGLYGTAGERVPFPPLPAQDAETPHLCNL